MIVIVRSLKNAYWRARVVHKSCDLLRLELGWMWHASASHVRRYIHRGDRGAVGSSGVCITRLKPDAAVSSISSTAKIASSRFGDSVSLPLYRSLVISRARDNGKLLFVSSRCMCTRYVPVYETPYACICAINPPAMIPTRRRVWSGCTYEA